MRAAYQSRAILFACALVGVASSARSDEPAPKLPPDMTKKEKKELSALEKAVEQGKTDIQKRGEKLVAYYTAEYPDTQGRLDAAGFPSGSAGVPGGTRFQPGVTGRMDRDNQIRAAKQKATHEEAHKALQPLIEASKEEIAKKTKEAKDQAKKAKNKPDVDVERIKEEATKRYVEKDLPISEKYADDDYRKDKKALTAKLATAERNLKRKTEAIIKAHPDPAQPY